ncbi:MAG: ATP cone domain-containing protein [Candidatus Thermoplasmatota archaeon]
MVKKVIKKDKRKEDFIPEKIVVSTLKAGAKPDSARKIAVYIEGETGEEIDTEEIKKIIFEKLGEKHPDIKKNWVEYEKKHKKED